MQNRAAAIAIHNHPWQPIALAPDHATQPRIHSAPYSIFCRLRDPPLKKIQIEFLFSSRKSPRHDLRFAVINRAPDQPVFSILERNHIAVRRVAKDLQHLARKHPIVPVQDASARFDNKSGHIAEGEW